jgi:hypothetical protein
VRVLGDFSVKMSSCGLSYNEKGQGEALNIGVAIAQKASKLMEKTLPPDRKTTLKSAFLAAGSP